MLLTFLSARPRRVPPPPGCGLLQVLCIVYMVYIVLYINCFNVFIGSPSLGPSSARVRPPFQVLRLARVLRTVFCGFAFHARLPAFQQKQPVENSLSKRVFRAVSKGCFCWRAVSPSKRVAVFIGPPPPGPSSGTARTSSSFAPRCFQVCVPRPSCLEL